MPPQNLEAEQAVLGGILIHSNILSTIVDHVGPDDFYSPAHRTIFQTFVDLYSKSKPIDLVTAANNLDAMGKLNEVGGGVYLAELAESTVSPSNAEHHAMIVREKSIQRTLIGTASEIIEKSFDSVDVEELLDHAESEIFKISDSRSTQTVRHSKDIVNGVFEELTKRAEQKSLITGVPSNYADFDRMTAGLQPSDLIIIAGRPSMGKTAFALNVALRAAIYAGVPTAIFSLEMSTESLMQRMLCVHGHVELSRMRSGYLEDEDWAKLYQAAEHLSQAPIFIDDTGDLTTLDLRSRCRRLKAEHGLGLVVVDYLQLMHSSRKIDSREQEISDISRTMKALAKELSVPVVALSQLNRKVEERTNKRPMLSDLRESGAIEQDADIIIFLYRDEFYNKKEDNPKNGVAEIIIGKHRNGPTGTVELTFLNKFTAFEDLAEQPVPSENGFSE